MHFSKSRVEQTSFEYIDTARHPILILFLLLTSFKRLLLDFCRMVVKKGDYFCIPWYECNFLFLFCTKVLHAYLRLVRVDVKIEFCLSSFSSTLLLLA